MWRDPMDELIADLEQVVEATPPQFNDQIPSVTDVQHWNARILRRADAEWDGKDPDELDPTYEQEWAAFQARWPHWCKRDPPDRT